MTEPAHPLADRAPLSWAMMRLTHEQRALGAARLAAIGLFPGQDLVLAQLWARDGRSQKELVERLGLDHSTVAKSVQRLERAGLISRSRSAEDGRVQVVSLTAAGRALEKPVLEIWDALEARWAERLDAEQLAQLTAIAQAASSSSSRSPSSTISPSGPRT